MSRTYRNIPNYFYRSPKTHSHRKQIESILTEDTEYSISKINRIKSLELPSTFDDISISAWHEIYRGE